MNSALLVNGINPYLIIANALMFSASSSVLNTGYRRSKGGLKSVDEMKSIKTTTPFLLSILCDTLIKLQYYILV